MAPSLLFEPRPHDLEQSKDPQDRWQSARDLTTQLEWIAANGSASRGGSATNTTRKRERLAWIVAGVISLVAIAAVLRPGRDALAPAQPIRFLVMPPADGAFLGDGMAASNLPSPQLAMSPDGRQLAFVASTAEARAVCNEAISVCNFSIT